jgi:HSP20 family protein
MNQATTSCCPQPAATAQNASTAALPVHTVRMPVDVQEDAHGVTLLADMPGVKREDLRLQVEGDALRIEGDVSAFDTNADTPPTPTTRYSRAFTLGKQLDATQVAAELSQGVLRVRIPKAASAQARRINVTVN